MTLTIDIPEKMLARAKELGLPVDTLVSQTLDALAATENYGRPPMINASKAHRVAQFSGLERLTKAEREEIVQMEAETEAYLARFKGRPDLALQELVDLGFCYPDGQPTEHYR